MADQPSNIRGPLIDLDGVLYVGGDVIPGGKESLGALKRMGVQRRLRASWGSRGSPALGCSKASTTSKTVTHASCSPRLTAA